MADFQFFNLLIFGDIQHQFIVDLENRSHENVLGGSALYAAGGARCWQNRIAVVSRAHLRHQSRLRQIHEQYQVDFSGVKFHSELGEDRLFLGYVSPQEAMDDNPVAFYSSRNLPFPKELIGFTSKKENLPVHSKEKYLLEDIPLKYREITIALVCSDDLPTQLQLSGLMLNLSTKTLIIQSNPIYMNYLNFDFLPVLMKDLNTFITTATELTSLFTHRLQNIWQMAAYLCDLGCEHVVFFDPKTGFSLFDRGSRRRLQIPIYPAKLVDPTGILESFCGGYAAGIKKNFDPLEALVQGSISASFNGEGTSPFYGADSIPDLLNSRLSFARSLIKTI